jgi:hypothetical protein
MAVSAHGMVITFNGDSVEELGDVTIPALTRKAVEDTKHSSEDDVYAIGHRSYGNLSFDIALIPSLVDRFLVAWTSHSLDSYVLFFVDGASWSFLGRVVNVSPKIPVEGKLAAQVTIQVEGKINLAPGAHLSSILMETGEYVLQENGDTILLES